MCWFFIKVTTITAIIIIAIFVLNEIGKMLDQLTKYLGIIKIGLTLFIVYAAHPPILQAVHHSFIPDKLSFAATILATTGGIYLIIYC